MSNSEWEACVEIEVPFHDVDMMQICWHGNYTRYFEIARCKLLDHIDYNYNQMLESGYGWPVIELHVRYARPLVFQQRILVTAKVREYENRLKLDYLISDKATGQRLTKGHTIQVAVDMTNNEMCFVSPQVLFDKLGVEAS